jgi:hypothetical protein
MLLSFTGYVKLEIITLNWVEYYIELIRHSLEGWLENSKARKVLIAARV